MTTAGPGGFAADRLRSFVERVEKLMEEKKAISSDIRDVFAEAKGVGFETKAMRQVIARRAMDDAERDEQDTLLEVYEAAVRGNLDDRAESAEHLDDAVVLFNAGRTVQHVAEVLGLSNGAAGRLRQLAELSGKLNIPPKTKSRGMRPVPAHDPKTGEVFDEEGGPMVSVQVAEVAAKIAYLAGQNPAAGHALISTAKELAASGSMESDAIGEGSSVNRDGEPSREPVVSDTNSTAPSRPRQPEHEGAGQGAFVGAVEPETQGGVAPTQSPSGESVPERVPAPAGDNEIDGGGETQTRSVAENSLVRPLPAGNPTDERRVLPATREIAGVAPGPSIPAHDRAPTGTEGVAATAAGGPPDEAVVSARLADVAAKVTHFTGPKLAAGIAALNASADDEMPAFLRKLP